MKKFRWVIWFVCLTTVTAFAQLTSGKGKMKGIVTDVVSGEPLAGVTVKLYCVKGQGFHQPFPKTGADGRWTALYLRGGTWNLDFEKDGFEPQKISYQVLEIASAKFLDIEIKLKKIEGLILTEKLISELEAGNLLFDQKKYPEAIAKYEEILKGNPDVYIIAKNIGNAYFAMEDYAKAIEQYLKVYDKQPKSAEIITLIGNAYSNSGENEKAMGWFTKLNFDEIKDINTLYNIGVIFFNGAKYDDALRFFQKASEIDGEFADAFYQLGMTYTAVNKIDEAIAALKKFMELAPDSPNFQTAKAIVDAFSKVK